MNGHPLREALKCVEHIASCMTSKDQISVVVYDYNISTLMPLGPVSSQEAVKRLLSGADRLCSDLVLLHGRVNPPVA